MDVSRDRLEDVLVYPFLFFAVYTIVKQARGRSLREETSLEEVVKELPQEVARLLFNRRSGYKNLGALQKEIGPMLTGLQMEVRLDRLVPRDCEVTPQDSPVAWGKIVYNYAEERSARASYALCAELATSVASLWRRTLQSMWESDGCVDIKQLQEEMQRLKGYRLGNAFAEGALQKIAAAVQEISVRSAQGVAYSRKRKAKGYFFICGFIFWKLFFRFFRDNLGKGCWPLPAITAADTIANSESLGRGFGWEIHVNR